MDDIRQIVGDRNVDTIIDYHVHGNTQREIAEREGVTRSAVAMRLMRANERLNEHGIRPAWEM